MACVVAFKTKTINMYKVGTAAFHPCFGLQTTTQPKIFYTGVKEDISRMVCWYPVIFFIGNQLPRVRFPALAKTEKISVEPKA